MDWLKFFRLAPAKSAAAQDAPAADAPAAPSAGATPAPEEAVYAHMPEVELRASQQHRWLFDDGVVHWNQHRHDKNFIPKFAGLNFVKEAAKTRLWGRPADIVGDERVVLTGINWDFADLQGATLSRADLRAASLRGADLRNANLAGALLNGADLTDADLRGANLDGTQFARAQLARANLSGTSMKGTNLAWANLTHAVVGAKNLQDANLFGAVREGVVAEIHPRPQAAAE